MKTSYRIVALLLALLMLFTVVGCQKTIVEEEWVPADGTGSTTSTSAGGDATGNTTGDATGESTTTKKGDTTKVTSKTGTTKAQTTTEKKLTGKLEIQAFANTADSSKPLEKTVEEFEALNPDLEVTLRVGVNVHTQLLSRWMSNNPTDFVYMGGSGFPENTMEAAGKFYDLSDWIKTAKVWGTNTLIKDKLQDGMLIYNGKKLNKMPTSWGAYGLWYDTTYFKQNGLTMPNNYEELKAFTAKAEALGKSSICYPGVYSGYLVWGLVMPAIAAYEDTAYFEKLTGATDPSAFTDSRMKSVLQRLYDLAGTGAFMKGTVQLNHIESQMEWLNHKSLIIPNGLWLEDEMSEDTPATFTMQFSPTSLATKDQNTYVIPYIGRCAVAQYGKNRDNALEFLRYIYTDKVVERACSNSGSLPATKVDYSDWDYSASAKASIDVITGNNVKRMFLKSSWGTVDAEFNNVVNALVLHEIDATTACNRLYKACQTKIAEE